MQHEIKKITRIVDEMLTMFMMTGTHEMDVRIQKEQDKTSIYFTQYGSTFDDDYIEQLENNLNIQRQCEVEGYYWQLTGENDMDEQLFLVGAMIDQVIIEKEEGKLSIELVRFNP
ncbi:hypothetical protein HZI73_23890 [Vallitalea pronyensis]|uniref:Uncharacterized protein n=1 Tax=Vallitalea pronyensis TaxID=1348613 RepID=A0A8J8MPT6_9FIRM|nr:hypothetical protein [Vallitalea pronyensis]QUI25148.1 hypothetical protein HZI73_23890 [Vallitalea pronyensis]